MPRSRSSHPTAALTPTSGAPRCALVVFAASAGGLDALTRILGALPATFPAPIAIVQHRSATLPNLLSKVLQRRVPGLRFKLAEQGERMRPGVVYLAPPDMHLTVADDRTFRLVDGRRIHFVASSANPLFESAARVLDGRTIAIVLTGSGRDATDGVQSVHASGGIVIAQDPATRRPPAARPRRRAAKRKPRARKRPCSGADSKRSAC